MPFLSKGSKPDPLQFTHYRDTYDGPLKTRKAVGTGRTTLACPHAIKLDYILDSDKLMHWRIASRHHLPMDSQTPSLPQQTDSLKQSKANLKSSNALERGTKTKANLATTTKEQMKTFARNPTPHPLPSRMTVSSRVVLPSHAIHAEEPNAPHRGCAASEKRSGAPAQSLLRPLPPPLQHPRPQRHIVVDELENGIRAAFAMPPPASRVYADLASRSATPISNASGSSSAALRPAGSSTGSAWSGAAARVAARSETATPASMHDRSSSSLTLLNEALVSRGELDGWMKPAVGQRSQTSARAEICPEYPRPMSRGPPRARSLQPEIRRERRGDVRKTVSDHERRAGEGVAARCHKCGGIVHPWQDRCEKLCPKQVRNLRHKGGPGKLFGQLWRMHNPKWCRDCHVHDARGCKHCRILEWL